MKTLPPISFLLLFIACHSQAELIKIASIDWPPQLIVDSKKSGYINDIIRHVFKNSPYQLQIKTYPWSRAIRLVQSGEADALLAPAKIEAPGLIYPDYEVGLQRMCFFTKEDSTFQYKGVSSLAGMKIGILQDGSISKPLTKYVTNHPDQFSYMPYNKSYLQQSIGKLLIGRIDAFLFTYNSTIFALKRMKNAELVRVAGCDYRAKVYLAFTPAKNSKVDIIQLQTYFDQKMAILINSPKLQKIMHSYGLQVWREKPPNIIEQ